MIVTLVRSANILLDGPPIVLHSLVSKLYYLSIFHDVNLQRKYDERCTGEAFVTKVTDLGTNYFPWW